jgi:hypothetical protein
MNKTSCRVVRWIARIAGIALAVWLGGVSLDSKSVAEFLIHNIPSVVVLAAVVVGWRWPGWGAVVFAVLGAAMTWLLLYRHNPPPLNLLVLSAPFVLVAAMFLAECLLARAGRRATEGQGMGPVG